MLYAIHIWQNIDDLQNCFLSSFFQISGLNNRKFYFMSLAQISLMMKP